jgi:hypothetical protein
MKQEDKPAWLRAWELYRVDLDGYSTEDEWLFEAAFRLGQISLRR